MRTTVFFNLLLAAALLAGACDRTSQMPDPDDPTQTYPIARLKTLCTKASVPITRQITISGTVVSSDKLGEFEKVLVIEDASGGISVAVDHPNLNEEFALGTRVVVWCNGLTLCDYGGKIQLGENPTQYGAGRIPQYELARFVRRISSLVILPVATNRTFAEISSTHIDTYVRFDDVRFTTSGRWCAIDPETGRTVTTEHTIADSQGREFIVRVAATCNYATEPLPQGKGSLEGVIDYFNGKYSLRVTNHTIRFTASAAHPTAYLSGGEY